MKKILKKIINLKKLTKEKNENFIFVSAKMLYLYFKYFRKYSFQEIFFYEFYKLDKKLISTYFPQEDYYQIVLKINKKEDRYLLQDKGITLKILQNLIKRSWLDLRKNSLEEFENFFYKNPIFIAKKALGMGGTSVKVINSSKIFSDSKELYYTLKKEKYNIIEEFLIQHKDISKIYPNSVNTLRIHTLSIKGKVLIILDSSIRFGNKNGKIDSSEGITVLLNNKGIGISFGLSQNKVFYEKHPETNFNFLGIKIPYWEETLKLVKKAANQFPTIPFIGWDVAITPTGPEIIEGNFLSGFIITHHILYASLNKKRGCFEKYSFLKNYI